MRNWNVENNEMHIVIITTTFVFCFPILLIIREKNTFFSVDLNVFYALLLATVRGYKSGRCDPRKQQSSFRTNEQWGCMNSLYLIGASSCLFSFAILA